MAEKSTKQQNHNPDRGADAYTKGSRPSPFGEQSSKPVFIIQGNEREGMSNYAIQNIKFWEKFI